MLTKNHFEQRVGWVDEHSGNPNLLIGAKLEARVRKQGYQELYEVNTVLTLTWKVLPGGKEETMISQCP